LHIHRYHSDGDDDEDEYSDDGDEDEEEDILEFEDEYVHVPGAGERDVLDPSESASRSQEPITGGGGTSSALRHQTKSARGGPPPRTARQTRPPPSHISNIVDAPEPPQARRGKAPQRRRSIAEESSVMADDDDYPYDRRGQPGFYNPPGWGPVHHAYPGSRSTYSSDPFDTYPPEGNPFMIPPDPLGAGSSRGRGRVPMGARAHSGNELMSLNAGYYPPWGHPGYAPPFPYGYPQGTPSPHPPSKKATPGPDDKGSNVEQLMRLEALFLEQKEDAAKRERHALLKEQEAKSAALVAKAKAEEDKLAALRDLIMQHNIEQIEREKKAEVARQKEADAKAEAERRAADEKRRADEKDKEVKLAAEKAKLEAEHEAAKKALEEKEKWDKEMEELKKKWAEIEDQKKKFEAEAKALRPGDDMAKPPIRFKDAVGRKYTFPWHVVKTWKGMETLIRQAFAHVDLIGKEVHAGHYDLIGGAGEIILPQVWETMVKPDMDIEMRMWPVQEPRKPGPPPPPPGHHGQPGGHGPSHADIVAHLLGQRAAAAKAKKPISRRSMMGPPGHPSHPPPPHMPPAAGGMHPPPPPPPPGGPLLQSIFGGQGIPGIPGAPPGSVADSLESKKKKSSKDAKKKSSSSKSLLRFVAGSTGQPSRSSSTARRRT
jgi:hypothetical protein